jgi:hypothetical protein
VVSIVYIIQTGQTPIREFQGFAAVTHISGWAGSSWSGDGIVVTVDGGEIAGHGRCRGHLEQELEASGGEERGMLDIGSLSCEFSRIAGSWVWQKNPKRVGMVVTVPSYVPGGALRGTTRQSRISGNWIDLHKFGTSPH